jgi:hypothetical protein
MPFGMPALIASKAYSTPSHSRCSPQTTTSAFASIVAAWNGGAPCIRQARLTHVSGSPITRMVFSFIRRSTSLASSRSLTRGSTNTCGSSLDASFSQPRSWANPTALMSGRCICRWSWNRQMTRFFSLMNCSFCSYSASFTKFRTSSFPVQKVGSCVITKFLPAAAARLTTSRVDMTLVAIPVTGVSGSPTLKVSVAPPRQGTPRFALIRSTTRAAVSVEPWPNAWNGMAATAAAAEPTRSSLRDRLVPLKVGGFTTIVPSPEPRGCSEPTSPRTSASPSSSSRGCRSRSRFPHSQAAASRKAPRRC